MAHRTVVRSLRPRQEESRTLLDSGSDSAESSRLADVLASLLQMDQKAAISILQALAKQRPELMAAKVPLSGFDSSLTDAATRQLALQAQPQLFSRNDNSAPNNALLEQIRSTVKDEICVLQQTFESELQGQGARQLEQLQILKAELKELGAGQLEQLQILQAELQGQERKQIQEHRSLQQGRLDSQAPGENQDEQAKVRPLRAVMPTDADPLLQTGHAHAACISESQSWRSTTPTLELGSLREVARPENRRLQRVASLIMQHRAFDYFSIILVVANTIWIGVQAEHSAWTWSTDVPLWFELVDDFFCLGFVFENSTRILAMGCPFFYDIWNLFDLLSTVTAVFERLVNYREDMMKVLRIFRLIRITRVANSFPDLKKLLGSVAAAVKPLCWTMLLLGLLTYAFALAITQLVTQHKIAMGHEKMEHQKELLERFGSLQQSCLVLYMMVSEGIEWKELVGPLAEHISPLMEPIFSLFVAFQVYCMMNVITAYFVETARAQAIEGEKLELTEDLLQVFKHDMVSSGMSKHELIVTKDVFEKYSDHPKMDEFINMLGVDAEEGHQLWQLIDPENTGKVPVADFVQACARLIGEAKAEHIYRIQFQMRQREKQAALDQQKILEEFEKIRHAMCQARGSPRLTDGLEPSLVQLI
eukprot:TRINITY_DN103587_c0_g1_i1.p1 TRINITY_DN103587_c0_g1~~TRINITY_DN103587_c0_g1_i1.p1  ORF type:complete len:649 (+),score=113.75 TRINITY_DN103587_c0_g1_i1:28-1974(+)